MGQVSSEARRRASVGVAVFIMAAAQATAAPDSPLELAAATAIAIEQQPLLDKFDAEARSARDAAVSASQLPDPQLVAGVQDLPIQGREAYSLSDDSDTQTVIGISQTFPRAAKRRAKAELRIHQAARIDDQRALAAIAIERDVSNTWIDVWREERARSIALATLRDSELQRQTIAIGVVTGRTTQADLVMARVAAERFRDAIAAREQAIARARASLHRWIGDAADRPLPEQPPSIAVPNSTADALDEHPELVALQARVAEADAGARLAEAAYAPDWRLEVGYGNRREFSDMVMVKVGMDLPLFTHDRQDRDLASALAMRDAAEFERQDARRQLTADVLSAQRQLTLLADRERRYADVIVPETARLVDAAVAAWSAGSGSLTQVFDARRTRLDAQLAQVDVVADVARQKVQLIYLSGAHVGMGTATQPAAATEPAVEAQP